jgi:hypothetical protein
MVRGMRVFLLAFVLFCQLAMAAPPSPSTPPGPQARALSAFIAKKKFLPETLYPGAMNEPERLRFEATINALAVQLQPLADRPNPKEKLMAAFKAAYPAWENEDTEERERALGYFEELMGILGVKSSNGVLNRLLYGFDPGQSPAARNAQALAAMTAEERGFAAKLEALRVENAEAFLVAALGPPTTVAGGMQLWMKPDDPGFMLSLTRQPKGAIVWMVKDRFLYTKAL